MNIDVDAEDPSGAPLLLDRFWLDRGSFHLSPSYHIVL